MCLQNQFSRRTDVLLLDKEEKLVQAIKTYFSIKNMNISVATKISTAFLELKKKITRLLSYRYSYAKQFRTRIYSKNKRK